MKRHSLWAAVLRPALPPLPWGTKGMSPSLHGPVLLLCPLSNFQHTVILCYLIECAGLNQWLRQVMDGENPSKLRKELPGSRVLLKRQCFPSPKMLASL